MRKNKETCIKKDCNNKAMAKGMCNGHYREYWNSTVGQEILNDPEWKYKKRERG